MDDPRWHTLREIIRVVRASLPKIVLVENVQGISSRGNRTGARALEEGLRRINKRMGTEYVFSWFTCDAANFGVPQKRRRRFAVAHRAGLVFEPPQPTHSQNALDGTEPVLTAWDAIGDLDTNRFPPDLAARGKWAALLPSIPEGHNYLWHTPRGGGLPLFGWRTRYWSFLLKLSKELPSWTISASAGSASGPFHWRNRRLSIEEIKRLQTFPEEYEIHGSSNAARRQLGNAVPPLLAETVGRELGRQFLDQTPQGVRKFHLEKRSNSCSRRERLSKVPKGYLALVGDHDPHPGPGKGPGVH